LALFCGDLLNWPNMLKNYFITAFRNLSRNKLHALINIIRLAIGITTGLMIISYVSYEFSYDKYLINHDRIFRLALKEMSNGEESFQATVYPNFYRDLYGTYPEIEASTHLLNRGFMGTMDIIIVGDKVFSEQKAY
jgi:putative ABC transport system permease protein